MVAGAYDLRGRQITEKKTITGAAYNTHWAYNSGDQVVSMTYPDGEVVTTAYNNLMQPNSLIGDNTYESNAAYDSSGRMISRTLGNGLTTGFTYNVWNTAAGRLKKITSGTLQDLAYTYDAVGNILGITDAKSGETQSYTYDSLDRLTGWKMNGIVQELYGYNASTGNLATSGGATLTYGEPSHDHAVTAIGSNTYSYDANGNQKARTIAGVTYSLGYDAENRMVSVSSSGLNASFLYDGDGRRVKSTINGVVTTFVGNHYEVSTGMLSKYYFLGGARVVMRQAGLIYYPLTDHLGSTTLTTDGSGAVVSELRYTAWGKTRFTSGSTPTKYQFTGQYSNEPDFGLMYFNARWYDSYLTHFSSPDTVVTDNYNTLDWDRYQYARSNPLKYTDLSGHSPQFSGIVEFLVGGLIFIGGIFHYDDRRRAKVDSFGCKDTLSACFSNKETKDFKDHEEIDPKEFDDMLKTIADDIDSKMRTPLDPARADYDTPFFTGNSMFGEKIRPDQTVCFGANCYQQSGVNYVAQGMYAANSGQDLDDAKSQANDWNQVWYSHDANKDELYWLEYGHNYYKDRKNNQPK